MTVRGIVFEGGGRESEVDPDAQTLRKLSDDRLLWISVDGDDSSERANLSELLDVPGNPLESRDGREGPAFDRHGDVFEVHLRALPSAEPGAKPTALDVVVGPNWTVTASAERPDYVDELEKQLRGDPEVGRLDSPAFLAALLDAHLSGFFRLAEELERRVDELDSELLTGNGRGAVLERLNELRGEVARLRRILAPHREVYAALARPDLLPIAESDSAPAFSALVERLERAMQAIESVRDQLLGSFDVYMTRTAQRTNDIMKALTVLSAVLLPAVALAGIMGMNFKVEFFESAGGFWVVIGAMAGMALLTLGFARWRGWI
jgi:magnesium transporter